MAKTGDDIVDLKKIGQFLAKLRQEKKLTQEQLGEKIGVTNKTISRWENGNYLPPVEMLMQLSQFYDISINELLSGERLSEDTFKANAEENVKQLLSQSVFTTQDRIKYFKRKWQKENLFINICTMILFVILSVVASCFWGFENVYPFSVLIATILVVVRYNRMMVFVEHWAYDVSRLENKN